MVKRHRRSGFMASAYVYPGGKLDPEDTDSALEGYSAGLNAAEAHSRLASLPTDDNVALTPQQALGLHIAAIRELFEEAGILLARALPGDEVTLAGWRAELEGGLAFNALVARENLTLTPASLQYFAHWITPTVEPRRYNTRFFLAVVPPDQEGVHDNRETVDSAWVTPQEALDLYAASKIQLAPPTLRTLEDMAGHDSIEALSQAIVPKAVPTILPRFETLDDKLTLLMPGDPLYPSDTPVQGPTRVTMENGRWWSR